MRRRPVSTLITGLTLVLGACGSGGTKGAATKPPTKAEVQAKLLTLTDVGKDWKAGQAINAADLASVTQAASCGNVTLEPAVAERLTAVTGIQFEPVDRSYKHLIQLAMTGEAKQLDSDLQTLFAGIDTCAATASAAPGSTANVKRLNIPQLGDQRAAYVMTSRQSTQSTATWYVRDAIVRVGPVAVAIGLVEILPTAQDKPTISDASFLRLLQTGVDKLRA